MSLRSPKQQDKSLPVKVQQRFDLMEMWGKNLQRAAYHPVFTKKPVAIRAHGIRGPRVAILQVSAGFESGALLKGLLANQSANLRYTIPWKFEGHPYVYVNGATLCIEAPWPEELRRGTITLSEINGKPHTGGRWVAGALQNGATKILELNDKVVHYLFAGTTGSGKSTALQGAIAQFSSDPDNQIVLIDGKFGDGLGCVAHWPGVAGPMATDIPDARAALQWALLQMQTRYETKNRPGRIIVVVDELQELTGPDGDDAIVSLIRKLAAQGRGAGVHLIVGTQHPSLEIFSESTARRQFDGRCVFRVTDRAASTVAMGSSPARADWLTGEGDGYACCLGHTSRVQWAYVNPDDLAKKPGPGPAMDEWPGFDAEAIGPVLDQWSAVQVVEAVTVAAQGKGRPALETVTGLGSTRARNLLRAGKAMWNLLGERGFTYVSEND